MEVLIFINNKIKHLLTMLMLMTFLIGCNNESKLAQKAILVKHNMNKEDVLNIMGAPNLIDTIKENYANIVLFYYFSNSPFFSDDIIIWFNNDGLVYQVSLPKGYSENFNE